MRFVGGCIVAESVRSGSADSEAGAESHSPAEVTYEPAVGAESSERSDGPCCGFCGSRDQHLSTRTGLRELVFKCLGAALYRCERCGHRFAFAPLSRRLRRRRRDRAEGRDRSGSRLGGAAGKCE
jgi:hypothetical protein